MLSRNPSPPLEPLEEPSGGPAAEAFAHNCDDSASISSFSLGGSASSSASLPRGRQGLSAEQEETASLVSTGTLVPEGIYLPPPGYQLVPDAQWEQLQVEVRGRGRGCQHQASWACPPEAGARAEEATEKRGAFRRGKCVQAGGQGEACRTLGLCGRTGWGGTGDDGRNRVTCGDCRLESRSVLQG